MGRSDYRGAPAGRRQPAGRVRPAGRARRARADRRRRGRPRHPRRGRGHGRRGRGCSRRGPGHGGRRLHRAGLPQVVIASAPGTCFSDTFAGDCGSPSGSGGYCAWHSSAGTPNGDLPFTNLPFQLDAGYACGENWVNQGYYGEFDGFTTVAGHEYAETVTDPFPHTGWDDTADAASGGEIADKCAWGGAAFGVIDPAGNVTLPTGTFAMLTVAACKNSGTQHWSLPLFVPNVPGWL